MNRLVYVSVVLLVLTAGCESGVPAEPSPTATAGPTGYDRPGAELSGTALQNSHDAALDRAANVTIAASYTLMNASGAGTEFSSRARVNETAGYSVVRVRAVGSSRQDHRTVRSYTADGRTVQRVDVRIRNESAVRYRSATAPYRDTQVVPVNETNAMRTRFVRQVVDALAWNATGTEVVEGTPATRYNATGVRNATAMRQIARNTEQISEVRAVLLVAGNGLVVRLDFEVVGGDRDEVSLDLGLEVSGVNRTTVSRPAWVDDRTRTLSSTLTSFAGSS